MNVIEIILKSRSLPRPVHTHSFRQIAEGASKGCCSAFANPNAMHAKLLAPCDGQSQIRCSGLGARGSACDARYSSFVFGFVSS